MTEDSRDRRHVSGFGGFIMRPITIAIVLSGLLAACGQQSPAAGEAGAPVAELDFIEAVPIVEEEAAPVVQPQPAAKKKEPKTEAATENKAPDAEARSAPPPSAEPATADDAATATRRANETTAMPDAGATTETPQQPD